MNESGQQFYWMGTYSFKPEVKLFLNAVKRQIDAILNKIEKAEEVTNSTSFD